MKKTLYILLGLTFISTIGFSQFRASLAEGAENSITFLARPNMDVVNKGYSTIEYFVRYPKAAPDFTYGTPVGNTTNFPGMGAWQIIKKPAYVPADPTYWYDHFIYTGPSPITGLRNYTANTVYEVLNVPVIGAPISNLSLTLVHKETEDYYYAFTDNVGSDGRPVLPEEYFFPATSVTGVAPSRVYAQDIILPVNFLSFFALKNNDNAKLSWEVDGDKDNKYFEVLRSINGRDFKSIQKIDALGNGSLINKYQAEDFNLSKLGSKEVFYQIKQTDKDGQTTKSAVRLLSVDGLGKAVTAFPNPARTTTKVVVDAPSAGQGTLILRDASGRQMNVINAHFFKGINQFDMNLMNMASGEYNIQVNGGGVKETIKITKVN